MAITRTLTVIAVHGEGDRAKVNADKAALNRVAAMDEARAGRTPGDHLTAPPDEPPQVLVVLRDDSHHERVELHLTTWEEVDALKAIAGYDAEKRHWKSGAQIVVTYGQ
jgi:hypothetical protein